MRNKATSTPKKTFFCVFLLFSSVAFGQWRAIPLETNASFRSLHVVSEKVIWAGGSGGTILKSTDAGQNWEILPYEEKLDFRGISGFDASTAIAMAAGEAEKGFAKIIKTTDGGKTWRTAFQTTEKGVFLDCLKFVDKKIGYVLGDPLNNKSYVLKTIDGGNSWQRINPSVFPDMLKGEASFAASNSNISLYKNRVLFCTQSRVFVSENSGKTWTVIQTPFQQRESAGVFGLYFVNEKFGFAVGGDYLKDKESYPNVAITTDGGYTWEFTEAAPPQGLKESVWEMKNSTFIAVGTSGTSVSHTNGKTWQAVDSESLHVVQCFGNLCLGIGGKGKLMRWE